MTLPSVSVVIPTNRGEQRGLGGVLSQQYDGPIEVLLVMDDVAGHPPSVSWGKNRVIRFLPAPRKGGAAAARNLGAERAEGEFLAFCDDDDEWSRGKLTFQAHALNGEIAISCGINVVANGKITPRYSPERFITLDHLLRSRRMDLHTSTLFMRRETFLDTVGPFDTDIPGSFGEDYEWLLRAAKHGRIATTPLGLVDVHWSGASSFQTNWEKMAAGLEYILAKHPEIESDDRGHARILGQIAFAYAALGNKEAMLKAGRRCMDITTKEPRVYLAYWVWSGAGTPETVLKFLHKRGKGI